MNKIVNKQLQTRKKLVKQFCRSAVWVDDELDRLGTGPLKKFFITTHERFSKEGILCHLQEFKLTNGSKRDAYENPTELESVFMLSESADIVILDWELNGADAGDIASKIIRSIVEKGGLRFIFIITKNKDIATDFEKLFQGVFHRHGTDLYATGKGQFLGVYLKPDREDDPEFAERVLNQISGLMLNAYTDYLHWIGIELVTRIRSILPKLLSQLPQETDLAMHALHQNDSVAQVNETILSSLLDDLKVLSGASISEVISTIDFKTDEWIRMGEAKAAFKKDWDSISSISPKIKAHEDALEQLKKTYRHDSDEFLSFYDLQKTLVHLKLMKQKEFEKLFTLSSVKWGRFCETVSFSNADIPIATGTVIEFEESDKKTAYAVCISPACDCLRRDTLLFSVGRVSGKMPKPPIRLTRHDIHDFDIAFDASDIRSFNVDRKVSPPTVKGAKIIGMLRERFAFRLVNRIWANLTRVGVDTAYAKDFFRPESEFSDAQ